MSISKDQARMLTALAIACRPVGAPKWDDEGTFRAIGKINTWPIAMVCEHVIAHASDAKAKTPGVIGSAYKPEKSAGRLTYRPPRREESCARCGRFLTLCLGTCADVVDDYEPSPDLPPVTDVSPRLAARLAALTKEEDHA